MIVIIERCYLMQIILFTIILKYKGYFFIQIDITQNLAIIGLNQKEPVRYRAGKEAAK